MCHGKGKVYLRLRRRRCRTGDVLHRRRGRSRRLRSAAAVGQRCGGCRSGRVGHWRHWGIGLNNLILLEGKFRVGQGEWITMCTSGCGPWWRRGVAANVMGRATDLGGHGKQLRRGEWGPWRRWGAEATGRAATGSLADLCCNGKGGGPWRRWRTAMIGRAEEEEGW